MKKLTKLISVLTLAIMLALTMGLTVGCSKGESWTGSYTVKVTVYLADGTTPASGIRLALCGNTSETESQCLQPVRTDANGVATIEVTGQFIDAPCLHFYKAEDIPTGYGFPDNMTTVTLNDGAKYENALTLTSKTVKLVLTEA